MTDDWLDRHRSRRPPADELGAPPERHTPDEVNALPGGRRGERVDIPIWIRRGVIERDGNCKLCGFEPMNPELDHIIPWSKGGGEASTNLRLLCRRCNYERQATFSEADNRPVLPLAWDCPDCWPRPRVEDPDQDTPMYRLVPCWCLTCHGPSGSPAFRLCDAAEGWDDVPHHWRYEQRIYDHNRGREGSVPPASSIAWWRDVPNSAGLMWWQE